MKASSRNYVDSPQIKRLKKLIISEKLTRFQLVKARQIIDEVLGEGCTGIDSERKPAEKLLGGDFDKFRTNYVSGISPVIKSVVMQSALLKDKLDSIFIGLAAFLRESNYPAENWHALANSIATHARIIHRKSPGAPALLYISLDRKAFTAKVVVLDSPTPGDIYSELYPDTKAINSWIRRLKLE